MNRPKPIAAFDLDGTLFKTSMLDAVCETAIKEGFIHPDMGSKIESANSIWQHELNNEETYPDSVQVTVKGIMEAMRGHGPSDLRELVERAAQTRLRRRRFVSEAMRLLKETHEIVIISASYVEVTKIFLAEHDIDIPSGLIYGSSWDSVNDRFTGEGKTIDKTRTLQELVKRGKVILKNSCAFGDTISDLGMLDSVDIGFMVNPAGALEEAGASTHETIRESKNTITHITPGDTPAIHRLQTPEQILERCGLL